MLQVSKPIKYLLVEKMLCVRQASRFFVTFRNQYRSSLNKNLLACL